MGDPVFDSLVVLIKAALDNEAREVDTDRPARDLAAELTARREIGAHSLVLAMREPCGQYLETTLARQYLSGEISAQELAGTDVDEILAAGQDPRRVGTGQIRALLIKNGMADAARASEMARAAEVSIYNRVIHISQYVIPTMRTWENREFVALYSSRLATVLMNLDPESSICREYGTRIYQRLVEGSLQPGELGAMSAESLCPAAFQKEKEEIASRSGQRVEEKVSALWACPECKARSCTYREVQDRAADEPASIYCTCTVCGHNFKPH